MTFPSNYCARCMDEVCRHPEDHGKKVQTSGKSHKETWESHRDPYKHEGWVGLGYGSWSGSFDK